MMKNPLLKSFLKAAIDLQELPYAGIRVVGSALLATNGYQLVAWRTRMVDGDGMLHPVTTNAILAYADIIDSPSGLVAEENGVKIRVWVDKFNTQTVVLPAIPCSVKRIETIFDVVERSYSIAERIPAKYLLPPDVGEFVRVDKAGKRLAPATEEEDFRYSVKQIRKCAEMFRAKDELKISVGQDGCLIVEDEWFRLFIVTPFRRPQQQ
jgi:hypothetical protein